MVSPQQFSSYLRKPYDLDVSAEANLRSILQQHPYFSNAHLLLARSLHNQKSPAFDDALKQAAMFAGERPLLYKLVNIDEKEAAPLEKNFDSPAAITTAPTQQNEQPTVETTENTPADTYQAPEQVIAPTVEVAENIAAPEVEATEEHTETEEFVLPVTIEEPTTETVNEEQPEEDAIEYALEENTYTPKAEIKEDLNEEDKVKSAYEEIFGNTDNKDEDISTDFESFDDDDDFVLLIDDNDTTEVIDDETSKEKNSETDAETKTDAEEVEQHSHFNLAPETSSLNQEQTTEEAASLADQEEFEAEIGYRLDNDGDGIIAPSDIDNTPEEEFELNVADAIAANEHEEVSTHSGEENKQEAKEPQSDNEFAIGDSLHDDNIIIPVPDDDAEEEDFDLNASEYAESEQDEEIVRMMEQSIEEIEEKPAFETFEESTLEEPIAFKLEPKTTPQETSTTPAENTVEPKTSEEVEAVTAKTKEAKEEKAVEEETTTSENVLLDHNTFFEWLGQLQNLQANNDEKKSIPTEQPKEVEKVEKTIPTQTSSIETKAENNITPPPAEPATPPKKTSTVDDIINKFISINPTISRPKAEFYNPTLKSKESDTEKDDLATETLAKIYSDQQLNEKAIDVYQRLIKRFPHKAEQYKAAIAELEGSN